MAGPGRRAHHKPLIEAAYALNEGGGGTLAGAGADVRPLFHSVQAAEKVPVNFTLTATNPGGHSSVPRPDNAIYALAEGLTRLARHQFPVALNEVTRPFFQMLGSELDFAASGRVAGQVGQAVEHGARHFRRVAVGPGCA